MLIMRLMGKRQIGQLQPFEFVLSLMVADLAAIPIASTSIPIFYGIIPVLTLFIVHTAFSYISLKSGKFRSILCGRPIIVVERGKILVSQLKRLNYSLADLMEQLRVNNIMDLADIDYAILETNGNLSVLEKKPAQKATVADLSGGKEYGGLPLPVIVDGKFQRENMLMRQWDQMTIADKIKEQGIIQKDVFVATLDENGSLYMQTYAGEIFCAKLQKKGA